MPELVKSHSSYFDIISQYFYQKDEKYSVLATDDIVQDLLKLINNIKEVIETNIETPSLSHEKLKDQRDLWQLNFAAYLKNNSLLEALIEAGANLNLRNIYF